MFSSEKREWQPGHRPRSEMLAMLRGESREKEQGRKKKFCEGWREKFGSQHLESEEYRVGRRREILRPRTFEAEGAKSEYAAQCRRKD